MMLSVIIPTYNEEAMVSIATKTISDLLALERIDYELLFINDGSKDNTWSIIKEVAKSNQQVKAIRFSRNFGKEAAIFAGMEASKGDCCVVMDCDLQFPPEKIVEMYRLWEKGYEVVEGVKRSRGNENAFHKYGARGFYWIISRAVGFDMSASSDFKLLDKKVVTTLNSIQERSVFFRALSFWCGFQKTEVYYDVQERMYGETKWSTIDLVKYAISNICSFSSAPLQIVTGLGVLALVIAIVFSGIALIQKIKGVALEGFTTLIILLLFIGSIIMISLGIIGYYIGRIYTEIKARPRYVISEVLNYDED